MRHRPKGRVHELLGKREKVTKRRGGSNISRKEKDGKGRVERERKRVKRRVRRNLDNHPSVAGQRVESRRGGGK